MTTRVHRFNRLVFIVLFPPMMFENLYGAKLSTALNPRLIVFALVFLLSYIALSIPVVQKLEKKPETRGAMIQAMYRSNSYLWGFQSLLIYAVQEMYPRQLYSSL